ncbi:MAG TPA: hypothetical protein DGU45_06780 [Planctomycetes bacterium]|nr:hypothetical protein [Planctomycetota bacterium]
MSLVPESPPPMTERPLKRLALYSHDGFGLGHFRRCLLLAQNVQEHLQDIQIMLITGSPKAAFFSLPKNTELVLIEPVTKDGNGKYISRNPQLDHITAFKRRRDKLRTKLLEFNPDLFVVDHVPTGLNGELIPLLADLKQRGTELAIGLRDIIDESQRVQSDWGNEGSKILVESLYDHIWVYGNQAIFDLGKLYNLSQVTQNRIEYLGYLRRIKSSAFNEEHLMRLKHRFSIAKKIVCVTGGGEDGLPVGETFLQTLKENPNKYYGTLITGPHLSRQNARDLVEKYQGSRNTEIMRFTTHLEDHLKSADLIVSMGGYNATLEAIALKKPTIIIPRVSPRKEQLIRATKFAELNLIAMIHPDKLNSEVLNEVIKQSLERSFSPTAEEVGIQMDGIGNFLSRVDEILLRQRISRKEENDFTNKLLRA